MKEEKIVFLEAQVEEKVGLNQQLQSELQTVRAQPALPAGPCLPFLPLAWVTQGGLEAFVLGQVV